MKRYGFLAALLCLGALTACEKNAVQDITAPVSGAEIRFFHFGVNAPAVNFYANNLKLTAVTGTACAPPADTTQTCRTTGIESSSGTTYGQVGNNTTNGNYSVVPPGQYTLAGKISATTDKGLAIATVAGNLENGKFYSYYMSGFYNTTAKTVEAFVVEDPIPPALDFNVATVRFVNAISNSSPMGLFAKSTVTGNEAALGSIVAYKAAGAYATLPPGTYDLAVRTANSSTNAIARTGVNFSAGRVYTITARGDITVSSTTATNRPFLDNTLNR